MNIQHFIHSVTPEAVKFQMRRLFRGGKGVECYLCKSSIKTLTQTGAKHALMAKRRVVGAGIRPLSACPVCYGQERTRLMKYFFEQRNVFDKRSKRVLHIAPEYGLYRWVAHECRADYTACDIDPGAYFNVPGVDEADLMALPYEAGSFDVVICSHVLEHVRDDKQAMSEIRRVLKPDGLALMLVPYAADGGETEEDPDADEETCIARFGQRDHVRLYELNDFVTRLKDAGFNVELFDADAEDRVKCSLNQDELLPVCTIASSAN